MLDAGLGFHNVLNDTAVEKVLISVITGGELAKMSDTALGRIEWLLLAHPIVFLWHIFYRHARIPMALHTHGSA